MNTETVTILKQDFDDLCRIMSGLCVPASISPGALGAAEQSGLLTPSPDEVTATRIWSDHV